MANNVNQEYNLDTSKTVKALDAVNGALLKLDKSSETLNKTNEGVIKKTERLIDWQKKLRDATDRNSELMKTNSRNTGKNTTQTRKNTEAVRDQIKASDALNTTMKANADTQKGVLATQEKTERNTESLARSMAGLNTVYAEQAAALRKVTAEQNKKNAAASRAQSRQNLVGNLRGDTTVGALQRAVPLDLKTQKAINEAAKLETALHKVAAQSGIAGRKLREMVSDAAKGKLVTYTAATRRAGAAITDLVARYREVGRAQERWATQSLTNINKVTLSWRSYARFFATHLTYRAFTQSATAIREGITLAADFEKSIAEIRTISQDSSKSVNDWAKELRELSDAFPQSTLEIAEGAYQALSNQVVDAANTTSFLRESLRLAITAVSSNADAVNALSSVLNSYGQSAEHAGEVSAQLFKIVELGRIRLKNIANDLGNITILSSQLGVSFAEVGASLTTLTTQGVKEATAMTLLRNVMLKLIKPTGEMTDLLNQFGYETAEQAVAAEGWIGLVKKMADATKGSTTEIGKLFSRVRGIVGFAGLTSVESLKTFASDYSEILFESAAAYDEATKRAFDIPARRAEIELQKLKNFFTVDLGREALSRLVEMTEAFGGLTNAVKVLGKAVAITFAALISKGIFVKLTQKAILLTEAWKKLAAAQSVLKALTTTYLTSIVGLTAAVVGAGAAYVYMKHKSQEAAKQNLRDARLIAEATDATNKAIVREKEQRVIYTQAVIASTQSALKITASYRAKSLETTKILSAAWDSAAKNTTRALKAMEKALDTQTLDDLKDDLKSIEDGQPDFKLEASKLTFELEFEDLQTVNAKIDALTARAQALKETAIQFYDKGELDEARKYWDQAKTRAQEIVALQEERFKDGPGAYGFDALEESKRAVISLLEEQRLKEVEISGVIQKRIDAEREALLARKATFKAFYAAQTELTRTREALPDATPQELASDNKQNRANLEELRRIVGENPTLEAQQALRELQAQFTEQVRLGAERVAIATQNAFDKVTNSFSEGQTELVGALSDNTTKLRSALTNSVADIASTLKGSEAITSPAVQGLVESFQDMVSKGTIPLTEGVLADLEAFGAAWDVQITEAEARVALLEKVYAASSNNIALIAAGAPSRKAATKALEEGKEELKDMVAQAEKLDALPGFFERAAKSAKTLKDYTNSTAAIAAQNFVINKAIKATEGDPEKLVKLAQNLSVATDEVLNRWRTMAGLPPVVKNAIDEVTDATENTFEAAAKLPTAFDNTVSAARELKAQLEGGAAAAARIDPRITVIKTDETTSGRFTGKSRFDDTVSRFNKGGEVPGFSTGGRVKGAGNRDTVPAWLTPGEFVVRAEASRKNFGMISALNKNPDVVNNALSNVQQGLSNFVERELGAGRSANAALLHGLNRMSTDMARLTLISLEQKRHQEATVPRFRKVSGDYFNGIAKAGTAGEWTSVRPSFFNEGGQVPGSGNTDSVPAMLTPGEYVVNSEATSRNAPLLAAINAGRSPVNNNTNSSQVVGDIHLNLAAPANGAYTDNQVIALGKQLNKVIRRGALKLG